VLPLLLLLLLPRPNLLLRPIRTADYFYNNNGIKSNKSNTTKKHIV
jgi:hypothetical protein